MTEPGTGGAGNLPEGLVEVPQPDAVVHVAPPSAPPELDPRGTSPGAGEGSEAIESLRDELAVLGRRVDELVRLADRREDLVDRLHADNQRLRAGEIAQVQAPILRELIRSYDVVVKLAGDSAAAKDLEFVRRGLLDSLERAGVRLSAPEEGAPFDPGQQVAVERAETADPAADMTVARTLRPGFVQDGTRVLRPAEVAVQRYGAAASPAQTPAAAAPSAKREE